MRLNVLKNHVSIIDITVDTPDIEERYEIYVGRSEDCHVRIDDPLISRHHFVLRNDNGKWSCEKLSQLGTLSVRGNTSPKIDLIEGDEIKCGEYSIFVSQLGSQALVTPKLVIEGPITKPQPVSPPKEQERPVEKKPEEPGLQLDELDSPAAEDLNQQASSFESDDNSFGEQQFSEEQPEAGQFESGDLVSTEFSPQEDELLDSPMQEEEKTQFFKSFVNYQLILFGERAPYDRYLIDQDIVYIGRDTKKCQIILDDPEVSSVHAVIRKNNNEITLEDLNSSNGTILNGERINKAQITTGDEFVIGSTSFTLETRSDLLEAESDRLMPVESGQVVEKEEIEEEVVELGEGDDLNFATEAVQEKSIIKRILKDPAYRKKAIYVFVGLGLLVIMFYEPETNAPVTDPNVAKTQAETKKPDAKAKKVIPPEKLEAALQAYELGVSFFDQEKYYEAESEFKKVIQIDPDYKEGKAQAYLDQTIAGLKRLEEIAAQERAEKERIATKKLVDELLVKAREAVKERQVTLAESLFAQIVEKQPENMDVQHLKLELDTWKAEEERKALEKAKKEDARRKMVDLLNPGKTFYLKKEWYRAILKLEEFLQVKGTDEDLVKEASDMLADAKTQLSNELGPLLGKARSLKEGQDLKLAYEAYLDVLKIEPTNPEALNEVDDIKAQLETRSKRVYREAIIAESLSLFNDAKEKFQEVQQISPTDSEYYRKATDKLRNYLE